LFYFVYNYDETYKKGNGMTEKKLPTGVGKKIVEALKKQNEIELELNNPVEDEITISSDDIVENDFLEDDLSEIEELITDDVNDLDLNEIDAIQTDDTEITEPVYEEPTQFVFEQESPVEYKEAMIDMINKTLENLHILYNNK
jgi:hydroxymethylpyrimidine pyrophosphatase-like HAD family hydrolase